MGQAGWLVRHHRVRQAQASGAAMLPFPRLGISLYLAFDNAAASEANLCFRLLESILKFQWQESGTASFLEDHSHRTAPHRGFQLRGHSASVLAVSKSPKFSQE